MGPARWSATLVEESHRLADLVRETDTSLKVPTCPDWTVTDLAHHVGRAHRWATRIVETRANEFLHPREVPDRTLPETLQERDGWLRAGPPRLLAAIADAGEDAQVWTWGGLRPATAWAQRMAYETLIHRVDAAGVQGTPQQVPAAVAADGVSELLDMLTSPLIAPLRPELRGDGQTLHLHATDEGLGEAGEWLVTRTPEGPTWRHGHGKGAVAVRAPAWDLLLLAYRRLPGGVSAVEVLGDASLLEHWLEHVAI